MDIETALHDLAEELAECHGITRLSPDQLFELYQDKRHWYSIDRDGEPWTPEV
jgi:hypothetical protein